VEGSTNGTAGRRPGEGAPVRAPEKATESRRRTYGAVLGVVALVSVLRLLLTLRRGGTGALVWVVAILVVAVVVVVTLAVVVRRVSGLAQHVARRRPGAVLIPAVTAGEMPDLAGSLGVSRRGLGGQGGSPVALAVLPDRVEVWLRGDEAPRWWVARTASTTVRVAPAVFGARRRDAVWVEDTGAALAVQPAYRPLRAQCGAARAELERCVQELAATQSSVF
jgi:hypothetical protein